MCRIRDNLQNETVTPRTVKFPDKETCGLAEIIFIYTGQSETSVTTDTVQIGQDKHEQTELYFQHQGSHFN